MAEEIHRPTWIFSVCTCANNSSVQPNAVKQITRSRVALEWVEEVILAAVIALAIRKLREHVENEIPLDDRVRQNPSVNE